MPYIGQRPATGEANSFKILDEISSYTLTFDGSSASVVSLANDTITEREHRFVTGQRVTYNDGGGTAITGLSDGVYYVIVEDRHTIKLASNATNASNGTAINLEALGVGASHTLNVAFDGVNTKFKATVDSGTKAGITRSGQLMLSINGVLQEPHDNTDSPTTGYATDHTSTIIFSAAPAATDQFFGRLIASNFATFDISDNTVDNFTGDGSTTTFTLSKTPASNGNVLVTIDGVVQYPDDSTTIRAYTVSENILDFASAPGNGVEIQVRHIGFAGATSGGGGVTGFYGRAGNAVLKSTDSIVFNNATASGTVEAANVTVTGNLTVEGTTTTLDTELTSVDKLEVAANNTTVAAAITQTGTGDILNLYDGSTEVFTVLDTGEVGIGTVNPNAPLDVFSNTAATDKDLFMVRSATGAFAVQCSNIASANPEWRLRTYSAEDIVFSPGGTGSSGEKVRIKSNGNVGIGTVNPTKKLEVAGGAVSLSPDTAGKHTHEFTTNAANDGRYFIRSNTTTKVDIQANGVSYFNGGNFGIGTDSPPEKLSIENGNIFIRDTSDNVSYIYFTHSPTANRRSYIGAVEGAGNSNSLVFATNGDGLDGAEKLRITSGGNVGIGVTNPLETLQVGNGASDAIRFGNATYGYKLRANISSTDDFGFYIEDKDGNDVYRATSASGTNSAVNTHKFYTSGVERIGITSTGRIEQKSNNEDIDMDEYANGQLKLDGNGYNAALALNAQGLNIYANSANRGIIFGTNEIERVRITNTGNVGIGTDDPEYQTTIAADGANAKLNIKRKTAAPSNGNAFGSLFYTNSDGNDVASIRAHRESANDNAYLGFATRSTSLSEKLRITSAGYIGIGTEGNTSPTAPLSIKVGSDGEYLQDFRGSSTRQWGFYYDQGSWLESTFRIDEFNNNGAATSRFTITDGGKIGIGITNPSTILHLADDSAPAQGSDYAALSLGSPGQQLRKVEIGARRSTMGNDWDHVGIGFKVHESNNNAVAPVLKMVLDYNGNLGINTTTPLSYGNSQATLVIEDDTNPAICISDTGQTRDWWFIGLGDGLGVRYADGGGSGSASDVTSSMFFKNNGDVGVNQNSPLASLHVYNPDGGNASTKAGMGTEAVLRLQPHTTNSTNMQFASINNGNGMGIQVTNGPSTADWNIGLNPFGGNIGFGQTNPAYLLDAKTTTNQIARFETTSTADMAIELTNAQGTIYFGLGGGEEFAVATSANLNGASDNLFAVKQDGKVGINQISPAAQLHVSGGNIRVDSGYGIDFAATGNSSGSMSSEVLDDYEEGSWTPQYKTTSGGSSGISHHTQSGTYVKIGKLVYIELQLATSDWSSGVSGDVLIQNLPFTMKNSSVAAFNLSFRREWNTDIGENVVARFTNISDVASIKLYKNATNSGGTTEVGHTDFMDGSHENYIYGSGCYQVP